MDDYRIGARVTYADANATISDELPGLVTGTVNGPPICDEDDGVVTHIPVWSERDNGREATTVYVAINNLMEVR